MNLKEAWQGLDLEKPPHTGRLEVPGIRKTSRHPVQRLRRAYLISIVFSIVFLLVFIALLFRFDEPIVRLGITTMIGAYLYFSWINLRAYQKIRTDFLMDDNLKSVLVNTYNFIEGNIRYQERVGLFIYPLALSAGYLMGLSSSSGNAAEQLRYQFVLLALAVVIILFTPICWLAARWMYRLTYGLCLRDLKRLIEEINSGDPAG